ncbi:MAG TPA: four helix bundle protein [Patescibacteria group bacterium]|nr:four helix bundle protein [Patescibacteria group bacterium]
MGSKIRSFTDLNAWREAHTLVLDVYEITREFPQEELFILTSQMRRCVISIDSNIAEGFSRNSAKDKSQFYAIALGSVTEIQSQLLVARDLKYLSNEKFKKIADQTVVVSKLINGLKKSVLSRPQNT